MLKYLVPLLLVILATGLGSAQTEAVPVCTDCYANIITQTDTQTINNVRLGLSDVGAEEVAVGNEGLTAGVIVTPANYDPGTGVFIQAGFARIDQTMDQTVSNLGSTDPTIGEGAKGITWNKAIQAAWIVNQGRKELDLGTGEWAKEGAYVSQSTTQAINNVYDYDSREHAKVLNVDNKLAMIVDDINRIVDLSAVANSATSDSQASSGTIVNAVEVTIAGDDPAALP
jgi:hypothetical protein